VTVESQRPLLLVEDSPEDFEATTRALKKAGLTRPIVRCHDGDECLDYLHRRGRYSDVETAPRPILIMLDLNLPGTDGREVLTEIKTDCVLRSIPVIVLTTSTDERDIERCYQAGANGYITKPVDLAGFMRAIQRFKDFWFETVIIPGGE
jgi:CheY-like chemotaxis protein